MPPVVDSGLLKHLFCVCVLMEIMDYSIYGLLKVVVFSFLSKDVMVYGNQ